MTKKYTVIYRPGDWFVGDTDPAWGQVTVEAETWADLQDAAHIAAKELGRKHGHYSWRLEERMPHELTKDFMQKYRVA